MSYVHWDREELTQEWKRVQADYDAWKGQGLTLNMARGKPGLEQLALSRELFTILDFDHCVEDGIDARNYDTSWMTFFFSSSSTMALPPYLVPVSTLYPKVRAVLIIAFCSVVRAA